MLRGARSADSPETFLLEARPIAGGKRHAVLLLTSLGMSQDTTHQQGVEKRGDQAMGFSHQMTTHHFVLTKDGGIIEVEADDPNDKASRDAIRQHLDHIATLFKQGDFDIPMFIRAQTPPGMPTMKRLKESANAEAVSAIHQFLTFQIKDHQTGDTTQVSH